MKWSPGFNDPGKRRTFLKTVKIEEARGTRLQSVRTVVRTTIFWVSLLDAGKVT
jgi:hypothetical protein